MAGPPPFALLPPALADPRGFLPHTVTRFLRPRIVSTNRRSATLCSLPASGSPLRVGFLAPSLRLRRQSRRASWVRRIASPHLVRLHTGRFAGYWVSLARVCSTRSPMPYSRFPGRARQLPARPPHRPVRAGFPHTVLQVTASLRRWSEPPGPEATGIGPEDGSPAPS